MNRPTSLYLDAVRFLAALTVFLFHVSGQRLTGGFLWQFGNYGAQAVTVFFVLSGFVIGYVADTRENAPLVYAVNRAARIYSVALPALIATFLLDVVGRSMRPDLYVMDWGYSELGPWQFLAGITFTNELWSTHSIIGSNLPYWSLGYEVWYYLIFGLTFFLASPWRWIVGGAALIIAGPRIASMFPIWLLGLFSYHFSKRVRISELSGAVLCFGSLVLWVAYEIWSSANGRPLLAYGAAFRGELLQDYVIGVLFAANLIGFHRVSTRFEVPLEWCARPIRVLASATFTLYILHLPVAQFLRAIMPWTPGNWPARAFVVAGTLVVAFVFAHFTEQRKEGWRRMFLAIITRWRPLPV